VLASRCRAEFLVLPAGTSRAIVLRPSPTEGRADFRSLYAVWVSGVRIPLARLGTSIRWWARWIGDGARRGGCRVAAPRGPGASRAGTWAGRVVIAPDFDAPLPNGLVDELEGNAW